MAYGKRCWRVLYVSLAVIITLLFMHVGCAECIWLEALCIDHVDISLTWHILIRHQYQLSQLLYVQARLTKADNIILL